MPLPGLLSFFRLLFYDWIRVGACELEGEIQRKRKRKGKREEDDGGLLSRRADETREREPSERKCVCHRNLHLFWRSLVRARFQPRWLPHFLGAGSGNPSLCPEERREQGSAIRRRTRANRSTKKSEKTPLLFCGGRSRPSGQFRSPPRGLLLLCLGALARMAPLGHSPAMPTADLEMAAMLGMGEQRAGGGNWGCRKKLRAKRE